INTGGSVISDSYDFKTAQNLKTGTTSSVLDTTPTCPSADCYGIADLKVKWLASDNTTVLNTLTVTDSDGNYLNPAKMLLNLAANVTYFILVTGTTLSPGGGTYNFKVSVTANTDQRGVPLPPALLLFGSALVGLTTLGRRKRKGASV